VTPEELRQRRKALGLSQRRLAEALGVTQHTVSRWEEGKIALTAPRSMWLDAEMKRVERERRPKRRRRPAQAEGGSSDA
jgi:transcriptional regulator with XRE-family HTH domain